MFPFVMAPYSEGPPGCPNSAGSLLARLVGDAGVGETRERIGFGPEPDLAGGKTGVGQFWNRLAAVQPGADFIAAAFNLQFMPLALGNGNGRPDGLAPDAAHHLVKTDVAAQSARSDDIKTLLILIAEDDACHLFNDAFDQFELRGQGEVVEFGLLIDQQGESFIHHFHAGLREDSRVRRARNFIGHRAPAPQAAGAGQGVGETGRRLIAARTAEIKNQFCARS
jgi:hypothetical protein